METAHTVQNLGYIPDEYTEDNYVLGDGMVPEEVLVPSADWEPFIPEPESQVVNNIETHNCTGFGLENIVGTILKVKYGMDVNYSDRAIGICAGTRPPGNSPLKVAEAFRKTGAIEEQNLPFDDSIKNVQQYYSPSNLPRALKREGEEWLEEFLFLHDWVFKPSADLKAKQNLMMRALQFSPLGVSVVAWRERGGKYFKYKGEKDTHFTVCIGFKKGEWWKIYDTYDGFIKYLEWDYDFGSCRRYYITKKDASVPVEKPFELNIIQKILEFFTLQKPHFA